MRTAPIMLRNLLVVAAFVATAHCLRCSSEPALSGGSSTDVGNARVSAVIVSRGGIPAAGATVRMHRSDWVTSLPSLGKAAITGADALTDDKGRFEIDGIDPGQYCIEVSDDTSCMGLTCTLTVGEETNLGSDTLHPFATVRGSVELSGTAGTSRFVQVYGLARLVAVNQVGGYAISDLPEGLLRLRIVAADSSIEPMIIDSVRTMPGSVTDVPIAGWRYTKRLYLNTTASGANVNENVLEFPLLVRPFECGVRSVECGANGEDIRFTKADGTPLFHEIERWDSAASLAEVWVHVDTIYGNSPAQWIQMSWGNASAASASDGAAVFDTSWGFAGVWQMSGSGGVATIPDQTARRSHGVVTGTWTAGARVPGIVGEALGFNGIDNAVVCATNVARMGTGNITLSAWVQTTDSTPQPILSYQNDLSRIRVAMEVRTWFGLLPGTNTWLQSPMNAPYLTPIVGDGQWHFMAAVYERSGMARLYVDGALGDSLDIASVASVDMSADSLVIGYDNFIPGYFTGVIDEVRFETASRRQAWVRLCFENQRTDQTLVELR